MTNQDKTENGGIPKKLKQADLARLFEVDSRRIRTLRDEGHFAPDEDGFYDVAEVALVFEAMSPDRRGAGKRNNDKDARPESGDLPGGGDTPTIAQSKAKKEAWAAEITRVKALTVLGEVIDRKEAEATIEQIGATTMAAIQNLEPKLKPHLSDDGRAIIKAELNNALRDLGEALGKIAADQAA